MFLLLRLCSCLTIPSTRAGVSGLTTAYLLSKDASNHVTVVAKHMPGDYDIEYCSPWAGANYFPSVTGTANPLALWLTVDPELGSLVLPTRNGNEQRGRSSRNWPRTTQTLAFISKVDSSSSETP